MKFKKYIFISLSLFIFTSCSGAMKNRKLCGTLADNVRLKKYDEALKNTKNKEFYPKENSQLLKNLETGTVFYLRNDYYQALKYFEKAKKISDDLYTIGIKNKIAATWDANFDNYYGEKYERSLIRFYISLINYNIYKQGFYEEYKDDKGVTIPKKILTNSEKSFHLSYARNSILEWDSLLQSMQNESLGKSVYKNDMLAKIWGAFIHSEFNTSNDRQIAIQLYKDANELLLRNYNMYPIFNKKSEAFNKDFKKLPNINYQQLYKNYIEETNYSKDLQEFIGRDGKNLEKQKKDNVVILIKDNLVAPKIAKEIKIPLPITSFGSEGSDLYEFARLIMSISDGMPYILIEFPQIKNHETINKYAVKIYNSNGDEVAKTDLTLIEPITDIAKKTLDDNFAYIETTIITRVIGKYIAALSSAYAIYSQENAFAKIGALAAFKTSSIVINETSKADIRYWTTLASNVQMGGIRLENGNYKVEIFQNEKKVFEKNIEVQKNETNFIDLNI